MLTRFVLLLLLSLPLAACATSRIAQLEKRSARVESALQKEQKSVLSLSPSDPTRGQRLSHLTQLHTTLSAANIGLGTVPHLLEESQRPMAYDIIEEVYSTIEWNIPLGPSDPAYRALPKGFMGNQLNLTGARTWPGTAGTPSYIGD